MSQDIQEAEKREKILKEIFEAMIENFPQIYVRLPIKDWGRSENTEQNKFKKPKTKSIPKHITFKLQKTKDKEQSFWKKPEGEKHFAHRGANRIISYLS